MIRRRSSRWAVALLLAAGCSAASVPGQAENTWTPAPRTDRTPAAASPNAAVASASPDTEETIVIIGDHFIDPQTVIVKAGTTVTWRNSSGQHDVTSRDGLFRSPTLGESYSHTFTRSGAFKYYCSFHFAEMRGEVIVEPKS